MALSSTAGKTCSVCGEPQLSDVHRLRHPHLTGPPHPDPDDPVAGEGWEAVVITLGILLAAVLAVLLCSELGRLLAAS